MSETLSSTLLLTLLLAIGLFFFIKASTKVRTEVVQLLAEADSQEALAELVYQHFSQRSYQVAAVEPTQHRITFSGFVPPSVFLALFLTALATVGCLCLALVGIMLLPQGKWLWLSILLLAPGAGWFYWQTAGRKEVVNLNIEVLPDHPHQFLLKVTGHRDELSALRNALPFKPFEPTA